MITVVPSNWNYSVLFYSILYSILKLYLHMKHIQQGFTSSLYFGLLFEISVEMEILRIPHVLGQIKHPF